MKSKISILLCAVLTLASPGLYAATLVVLPGQSIQATITSASPGDQIIIKGGIYVESITIDKNLDFRREAGTVVHINGNVTLSGITGAFTFAHFKIGSLNNKTLTVTNCADVYMEDVNATGGGGLSVTNSKVRGKHCWFSTTGTVNGATEFYFYDCSFGGDVTFTSSNWTMQECTANNITSTSSDTVVLRCNVNAIYHATDGDTNCTVFQSTVGDYIQSKAKRSWIGYNTAKRVIVDGNGALEAEIVGNVFDKQNTSGIILHLDAANLVATIRNNVLKRNWSGSKYQGCYIRRGIKIRIHNNVFNRIYHHGIDVHGDTNEVEIIGNVFSLIYYRAVEAPHDGVICSYNWIWDQGQIDNPRYQGGVVPTDNLEGDPKFVAYDNDPTSANTDYTLQGSSPLINAGSPDPEFKDHDGTRQDIGIKGGHHFDTNGTTSSIPVVLSGNLSPIRIQKGVTGTVNLNSRAVVSTPKQ
jgi:hypothetical protein